jgi:hypothetical protein
MVSQNSGMGSPSLTQPAPLGPFTLAQRDEIL